MTDRQIFLCVVIVCSGAVALAAAYCLHMRTNVRDILRDEKCRLRAWAEQRAEIMAKERLRELLLRVRIRVPVTLVNESDIDWGEGKEKTHDAEHETLAA